MRHEELRSRLRGAAAGLRQALEALTADDLRALGELDAEAIFDDMRWLLKQMETAQRAAEGE